MEAEEPVKKRRIGVSGITGIVSESGSDAKANEKRPGPTFTLIKVPEFIGEIWDGAPPNGLVGALIKPGKKSSGPPSLSGRCRLMLPSYLTERVRCPIKSLDTMGSQTADHCFLMLDRRSKMALVGVQGVSVTFKPDVASAEYHKFVRMRREAEANRSKSDKKNTSLQDSVETDGPEGPNEQKLFKYFTPSSGNTDSSTVDYSGSTRDDEESVNTDYIARATRRSEEAWQRQAMDYDDEDDDDSKQAGKRRKRQVSSSVGGSIGRELSGDGGIMSEDVMKSRLFGLFESKAPGEGITLKEAVQLIGRPQSQIKPALESIAELKRDSARRKLTYVLKPQYSMG